MMTRWEEKRAVLQQEPSDVLHLSVPLNSCKDICSTASFNSKQGFQNAAFSQENEAEILILAYK